MPRKTIAISDITTRINAMIEASPEDHIQGRQALAVLLETLLMETGNYRGFHYLASATRDADGIRAIDDSRRCYFQN